MSQQIGKNFANNVVIGGAFLAPKATNYFGMLVGKLVKLAWSVLKAVVWLARQVLRLLSILVFAITSPLYVRKVAKYVDRVASKLEALSGQAESVSWSLGNVLKEPVRDFRVAAQAEVTELLNIAWLSVLDTRADYKSEIIKVSVEKLHVALDEIERGAEDMSSEASARLVKETRSARNEMIGLAYSMLGADVAREGDRNARKRAIVRNSLIAAGVIGSAIWWWMSRH